MTLHNKIEELIIQRLQQPFIADDDVIHFAESSLGMMSDEINDNLNDDNGILDLIIVPEFSFRKDIELLIPYKGIAQDEIDAITLNVTKAIDYIHVQITNSIVDINTTYYCRFFINKLLLHKENIVINREENSSKYIAARVAIRLYGKLYDVQLLQRLVDALVNAYNESIVYDAIKYFVTNINAKDNNIFVSLSMYKHALQKQLHGMNEFKKLLNQYSMEYLMSLKYSVPLVDVKALYHTIQLIDIISIALFGMPAQGFESEYILEIDGDSASTLINNL